MRIQRTIPPAAAPLSVGDLLHGLAGIFCGRVYRRRLESEVREHFDVTHVFLVSSGKAALTLILKALTRLSDRRQVLIPAYTCFSVPAAIVKAGLEMRLADVDPSTFDFDYESLRAAITSKTLCVVANHLFGIPGDTDRVRELCEPHGVFVIEDAAQAMGGRRGGSMLGSLGHVGFFSLGRGKNITAGSGGIVVTNSERIGNGLATEYRGLEKPGLGRELSELVRIALMAVFVHPALYWLPAGLRFLHLGETRFEPNFPLMTLSGVSAGVSRNWRQRLRAANEGRMRTARYFGTRLGLPNMDGTDIPYLRVPVLMQSREERDRAYAAATRRGLGISLMYPTPISEITAIRAGFNGQSFPAAGLLAERILALPTHHLVDRTAREAICDVLTGSGSTGKYRG